MGANYVTLTFDGELTKQQVAERFDAEADQDRYENGHSYSGGIGMATGLVFIDREFESEDDAYDFVDETAEKWGPAVAVRYKATDGKTYWFIGANCAS